MPKVALPLIEFTQSPSKNLISNKEAHLSPLATAVAKNFESSILLLTTCYQHIQYEYGKLPDMRLAFQNLRMRTLLISNIPILQFEINYLTIEFAFPEQV
jgi:hypothetical protein